MDRHDNTKIPHPGNPDGQPDKRSHPAYGHIRNELAVSLNKYFIDEAMLDHTAMKIVGELKKVGLIRWNTAEEIQDYIRRLKNADWYHPMSDDDEVYRRGSREIGDLRREGDNSELKGKLYKYYSVYIWNDPAERETINIDAELRSIIDAA